MQQSDDKSSFSYAGDIGLPIAVAAMPALAFTMLGVVAGGLDKPGAKAATWQIAAIMVLEVVGIVAMAFVILTRFESSFRQLSLMTRGRPAARRRFCLFLAIMFLLFFDLLLNVGAAFAGGLGMTVAACPMFVAYLVCRWAAFAGLATDGLLTTPQPSGPTDQWSG